jgi:hypothetical protein
MRQRTAPIPKAIAIFGFASVAGGTIGGVGLYILTPYLAPTITTLGVAGGAEGGLASLSTSQLTALYKGSQGTLLRELFKGGGSKGGVEGAQNALANLKVPPGLTKETLLVYQEIARRYIAAGRDGSGVQALRLKIVEELLKTME